MSVAGKLLVVKITVPVSGDEFERAPLLSDLNEIFAGLRESLEDKAAGHTVETKLIGAEPRKPRSPESKKPGRKPKPVAA